MDQTCYKCNTAIYYNPLQCDLCGVNICLSCCDDNIICENCKIVQEANMINYVEVKCTDITDGIRCDQVAVMNQDCSSNIKKYSKKVRKCTTPAQFCVKHIKRCLTCKDFICEKCYTNSQACWNDSHECYFCYEHYGSVRSCGVCDKKACHKCISRKMDFIGQHEIPICFTHRENCSKCGLSVYNAKFMRCQFKVNNKQCENGTCVNGWFDSNLNGKVISWGTSTVTTIGKKIYVCHKHITKCLICDMSFPMTNSRTIKFRNGMLLTVCTNCYKSLQSMIDAVLICLRRQNLYVPRDVFGIILGYVIDGNCH